MKVNKRMFKVQAATSEIHSALLRLQQEHDLTDIEMLQATNAFQDSALRYMLRVERHGDAETPADEVKD